MRVTKAIREYVEDEINRKHHEATENVGKEYYKEQKEIQEHIKQMLDEVEEKAQAYIVEHGYTHVKGYRDDSMFYISGRIIKTEEEDKCNKEYARLRDQVREKTRQVLFDLEMGETAKAELKSVLDSITIE